MTVNYEIKSQLAKLLATEDIVVENRNVSTACFDVINRVLTLPMWKRASDEVYDMLVGHEVGHALYTPDKDWDDKLPKQFINVTEDVRIEKLMKRRYAGLSKTFYNGYKQLHESDFFCLEGDDISKMNLADRINLYYKIGNFIDVPFTESELVIRKMVEDAETFVQAVDAARKLYEYCCEEVKSENQEQTPELMNDNSSDGEDDYGDLEDESEGRNKEDTETTQSQGSDLTSESEDKQPEVTTDNVFEEGKESLNSEHDSAEPIYAELPDVDMDEVIISVESIHQDLNESFEEQAKPVIMKDYRGDDYEMSTDFAPYHLEYEKFKNSAKREVNYLVKEFECKKAADAYSRSHVAKTGVLDCTKLHTYKYNEDLFKKVNVIPDGKNHGLIFILDWSGSMGGIIEDTVRQLMNLVWFCSKVNIPFEVYAFSNQYASYRDEDYDYLMKKNCQDKRFYMGADFRLLNLLSSRVSKKELDNHMRNLFLVVYSVRSYVNYRIPNKFAMGGTPLYESFTCLHSIIPEFKKRNKLQKVQCVILTDGEGHPMPVTCRYGDDLRPQYRSQNVYLRNRKTGHTYHLNMSYDSYTKGFLTDLKQTFPNTNFIGIRLCSQRELTRYSNEFDGPMSEEQLKKIRKNKSYMIKNSGYHGLLAMSTNSLSNKTDFDVDSDATKTQIKNAFSKSLKAKALNKKVLSQFMDLVC